MVCSLLCIFIYLSIGVPRAGRRTLAKPASSPELNILGSLMINNCFTFGDLERKVVSRTSSILVLKELVQLYVGRSWAWNKQTAIVKVCVVKHFYPKFTIVETFERTTHRTKRHAGHRTPTHRPNIWSWSWNGPRSWRRLSLESTRKRMSAICANSKSLVDWKRSEWCCYSKGKTKISSGGNDLRNVLIPFAIFGPLYIIRPISAV